MKIGLDLRFLKNNIYSRFVTKLIHSLLSIDHSTHPKNLGKIDFTLYVNHEFDTSSFSREWLADISIKKTSIPCGTFREQTQFLKILKQEKNDLMIFFNHNKPIFYKGEYYTVLSGLKDIYYQNFEHYIEKYKYLFLLDRNIKKSSKVICFDQNSKDELIEKFNIAESKINILPAFFMDPNTSLGEDIPLDIKQKFNIRNDYFIYSGGDGIEKNVERLIYIFTKIEREKELTGPNYIGRSIDLVILGDKIGKNLELRNLVINNGVQKNIHFLGNLPTNEKSYIYEGALGVLFPSLYEPFPFLLSETLYSNTPLLASDLKNIKEILGDKATYFSAISTNSILATMKDFIKQNQTHTVDYSQILQKYTEEKSARELLDIIS